MDKAKLRTSLKKARAKEEHATKVADKISDKVKDGTATVEIWEWVVTELKPLDPKAAEAYRTYRKPKRSTSKFKAERFVAWFVDEDVS